MKIQLIVSLIILTVAVNSFACDHSGSARHTNPDGSLGGLVANSASVSPDAYVATTAKVCGMAKVDAGAKILGRAEISDVAWIKEYVTIQGTAKVSGGAVLQGSKGSPVTVDGRSKVYGYAKINFGSKLQDSAEVYGAARLEGVEVLDNGKVCESFHLSGKTIRDDYFCGGANNESTANVELVSFSPDRFNKTQTTVRFTVSEASFLNDKEIFQIKINDIPVDVNDFMLTQRQLMISNVSTLIEGENLIQFVGRDEFGKTITSEFTFIIGSEERTISITSEKGDPDQSMKVNVSYEWDGGKYTGTAQYQNGQLQLKYLPANLEGIKFNIEAIGNTSIVVESGEDVRQLAEAQLVRFPQYKNDIKDFSHGLDGWETNSPGSITIIGTGKDAEAQLVQSPDNRVILTKTFNVGRGQKQVGLGFKADTNLIRRYTESEDLIIAIASHHEKKLEVYRYQLSSLSLFKKSSDEIESIVASMRKTISGVDRYSVFLILSPNNGKGYATDTPIRTRGVELSETIVGFKPISYAPRNIEANDLNPDEIYSSASACEDARYSDSTYLQISDKEPLRFFSAGSASMIPEFQGNRIFGDIFIHTKIPRNQYRVSLVGLQGSKRFEIPLAKCASDEFNSDTSERGGNFLFNYLNSIARYAFQVSPFELGLVDASPGAKIALYLKFETEIGSNTYASITSTPEIFSILTTPPLGSDYVLTI